jgi:large subunit ribosomal protein L9e
MVRLMAAKRELPVPEGVTVEVNARHVKVTGPRGKLEREFKHAKVTTPPRYPRSGALGLNR